MDPITGTIVIVLGKYALDKGVELGKEVGPKALEKAKEMFQVVIDRITQKKPETAAEFPNDPETYQKPMEKALDAEIAADPDLAAELKALLAQYEEAAKAHAAATGQTYEALLEGSGAIAQGAGAAAAGAGGVAVSGSVGGDVHVGGERSEPGKKRPRRSKK
jgi:hypothetical protein